MPESHISKMKVSDLKRELILLGLPVTGNKTELQERLQDALLDGDLSLEDTAISGEGLLNDVLSDEEEKPVSTLPPDEKGVLSDEEEKAVVTDDDELVKSITELNREVPTDKSDTGNKKELQKRLQKALLGGDLSLEDTVISGDGLLKDVLSDEEEKAIVTLPPDENELLKSPTSELERDIPADKPDAAAVPQPMNIVFKRKRSTNSLSTETTASTTPEKNDLGDVVENGSDSSGTEAKVLKLDEKSKQVIKVKSMLTWEERLQLRAKKFGLKENKVKAGKPKVNSISTGARLKHIDPKQIETLKKRAERFGCVLSAAIAKISADERLEKRKQRFADQLSGDEKTAPGKEKARQRLERFKTPTK